MKRIALFALLALALSAAAACAQTVTQYPLLDFQHRMSIGGRLYRSFDERPAVAASYTSSWWAGVPVAYILTGRQNKDGSVNPIPLSLIGALDIGLQGADQKRIRGYVGITALFKSTE